MEWSKDTITHLKEHVKWPAKGKDILESCKMMSDVPENEKMMAEKNIDPEMTYNTVEEAMAALNK